MTTLHPATSRPLPISRLLSAALLVACSALPAWAQLTPEKLYNGVNRPLKVQVTFPADTKAATKDAADAAAEATKAAGMGVIRLLEPGTAKPLAEAQAPAGTVDLAALFPDLWKHSAAAPARLTYAQLFVGEQAIGPALVLQPMLSPARAALDDRDPKLPLVVFPPARQPSARVLAGYRVYVDKDVLLNTEAGEIRVRLRPDVAPNTAWNFRHLVEGGYYDGTDFFRIIATGSVAGRGFVIQGGDPSASSPRDGGPGYEIPFESSTLPHDYGVLSMARGREPNSAGSQFFICLSREETARLDGQYTTFAEAVSGAEVIAKLASAPLAAGRRDQPIRPPVLTSAILVDAPPYGTGPKPLSSLVGQPGGR